jgi:hypothetical protein
MVPGLPGPHFLDCPGSQDLEDPSLWPRAVLPEPKGLIVPFGLAGDGGGLFLLIKITIAG